MNHRTQAEIDGDRHIAIAMMASAMEDNGAVSLKCVLEREVVASAVAESRAYLRAALGLDLKQRSSAILDELEEITAVTDATADTPSAELESTLFRAHKLVDELKTILKGGHR